MKNKQIEQAAFLNGFFPKADKHTAGDLSYNEKNGEVTFTIENKTSINLITLSNLYHDLQNAKNRVRNELKINIGNIAHMNNEMKERYPEMKKFIEEAIEDKQKFLDLRNFFNFNFELFKKIEESDQTQKTIDFADQTFKIIGKDAIKKTILTGLTQSEEDETIEEKRRQNKKFKKLFKTEKTKNDK